MPPHSSLSLAIRGCQVGRGWDRSGAALPVPRPAFGHGAEHQLGDYTVVCSYHLSRQNTQTGRLTVAMLDAVFGRVRRLVDGENSFSPIWFSGYLHLVKRLRMSHVAVERRH